jgi:YD repeat-containing protein
VTAIGTTYTASYGASGNQICRAPTSGQTCSGTPTGASLGYDNEGRLTWWQNAQSNPTSTEAMAYDGEGQRVALKVNGGTPTYYVGSLEEISGSTLAKYLGGGAGLPIAERVGTSGSLTYLAADGLGGLSEALDGSGTVTFQQLFSPYGGSRYSSGTSPTSYAFTGQRANDRRVHHPHTARSRDDAPLGSLELVAARVPAPAETGGVARAQFLACNEGELGAGRTTSCETGLRDTRVARHGLQAAPAVPQPFMAGSVINENRYEGITRYRRRPPLAMIR